MMRHGLAGRPSSRLVSCFSARIRSTGHLQAFRSFHASSTARFNAHTIVDFATTIPHELLMGLHNIGLPWAAVIPLSAVLIRATVLFPLTTLPSRRAQQRLLSTVPLRHADASMLFSMLRPPNTEATIKKDLAIANRRMNKRFGTTWSMTTKVIWQFPVFVALAETIRRMAGANGGLLTVIAEWITPRSEWAKEVVDEKVGSLAAQVGQSWVEPSFATEGMLWFQDLTAADPTLTLPFLVSALTIANLQLGSRIPKKSDKDEKAVINKGMADKALAQGALHKILLFGAFLIGPLTLQVPSGIMLYWASSSMASIAQNLLVDRVWPLEQPIGRCKRPLFLSYIPSGNMRQTLRAGDSRMV